MRRARDPAAGRSCRTPPSTTAAPSTVLRHSAHVPGAYQVTTGSPVKGDDHWITGRQRQGCRRCGGPVSVQAEVPVDAANRRTWHGGPGRRRPRDQTWCRRRAASAIDPLIDG